MSDRTMQDLLQMQSLPLDVKIRMTERRIEAWIDEFGEDGVYVSFSGGKDSTVLMDIVRNQMGYKNIPAVFVDVPTQFPELKEFATSWDNVEVIRPKISFMEVCDKYGFPLISKEVSECVSGARKYLTKINEELESVQTDRQTEYKYFYENVTGTGKYQKKATIPNYEEYDKKALLMASRGGTTTSTENSADWVHILNARTAMLLGVYQINWGKKKKGDIPNYTFEKSKFSQEKWNFFLNAPFEISNQCCNVMKKKPIKEYAHKTGRHSITAQMADESRLRTQKWLQNGCNGFNLKEPISNPMSFWTEQDILQYIKTRNIPICSVYGDIVTDFDKMGEMQGQTFLFETGAEPLKTTGCKRTGYMLCGFGCHIKGDTRFLQLKESHEKMYNLLDVVKNNGVTYREAIEWTNEHLKDSQKIPL